MENSNFVEKSHRAVSLSLAALILLCVPLYAALLISDSSTYKNFVFLQIGLLLLLSHMLWLSRVPSYIKLFCVWGLVCIATYINGVYLNYGNGLVLWVGPALALIVYSASSILVFKNQAKST